MYGCFVRRKRFVSCLTAMATTTTTTTKRREGFKMKFRVTREIVCESYIVMYFSFHVVVCQRVRSVVLSANDGVREGEENWFFSLFSSYCVATPDKEKPSAIAVWNDRLKRITRPCLRRSNIILSCCCLHVCVAIAM